MTMIKQQLLSMSLYLAWQWRFNNNKSIYRIIIIIVTNYDHLAYIINESNNIFAFSLIKTLLSNCSTHFFPYSALYKIWYRHSGEDELTDDIFFYADHKTMREEEIISETAHITITHMSIVGNIFPTIANVAPRLTDLAILKLSDPSQLEL